MEKNMLNLKKLLKMLFLLNINFAFAMQSPENEFIDIEIPNFKLAITNWTSRDIKLYVKRACYINGQASNYDEPAAFLMPESQVVLNYAENYNNPSYSGECNLSVIGVNYEKSPLIEDVRGSFKRNFGLNLSNPIGGYKFFNYRVDWPIEEIMAKIKEERDILENSEFKIGIFEDKNYKLYFKLDK